MSQYYVVFKGKTPGIYSTWDECKENIFRVKGAKYKKFSTFDEANHFLKTGETKQDNSKQNEKKRKQSFSDLDKSQSTATEHKKHRNAVYTDGSWDPSKNAAGSSVFFGDDDPRNLSTSVPGEQTNQRAELWAIKCALDILLNNSNAQETSWTIYTDSQYSIDVSTKKKRAFANLDIIRFIWKHLEHQPHVKLEKIAAHVGHYGNEKADKLARLAMGKVRDQANHNTTTS